MNLFLSSIFANVVHVFAKTFRLTPAECQVAFIANASDPYPSHPWTDIDRNALVRTGFNVLDIDLRVTRGKELQAKLQHCDILFVAGGNVSYLLGIARTSGLLECARRMVEQGKMYVGSSAGSILAGPSVEPYYNSDRQELETLGHSITLTNFEGMKLVKIVVMPHYNKPPFREEFEKDIVPTFKNKFELVSLTDDQAIAVKDSNMTTVHS